MSVQSQEFDMSVQGRRRSSATVGGYHILIGSCALSDRARTGETHEQECNQMLTTVMAKMYNMTIGRIHIATHVQAPGEYEQTAGAT